MPTLSVEVSLEQEGLVKEVLNRNPGWNKSLVVRALLAYFLSLDSAKQEDLVKKHVVKS